MGELSVNDSEQTEGGISRGTWQLLAIPLSSRLRRDTFPVNGDSFWLAVTAKRLPHMENWQTKGLTEGVNSQYPLKFCQK